MFSWNSRVHLCLVLNVFLLVSLAFASKNAFSTDDAVAQKLATLFRSARAVIAQNKVMVDDPQKISDVDSFIEAAKKNYARSAEQKLDDSDEATQAMLQSIKTVAAKAKSGAYASKWASDKYPGKFLPARFARAVAEEFSAAMKGKMSIKLTVSDDLLVNPENKADEWEKKIIDNQLKKTNAASGKAYSEMTKVDGKPAFRYILPEHYAASCLSCHGGEEGKKLHPGKIEGALDGFGGAISLTIFK